MEYLRSTTIVDALKAANINLKFITEIVSLDASPSTNTALLEMEKSGAEGGTFLITNQQSAGRGRLERSWFMAEGDIACSLLLKKPMFPTPPTLLSLMPPVAIVQALANLGFSMALKWPNDIVYQNPDPTEHHKYFENYLKVGGILIDNVVRDSGLSASVIGIGLNISASQKHKNLVPHRGHLAHLKPDVTRLQVLIELIKSLDEHLAVIEEPFYPEQLLTAYRENCASLGRELAVDNNGQKLRGKGCAINPDGSLCLKSEGVIHTIYGGEVNFCT